MKQQALQKEVSMERDHWINKISLLATKCNSSLNQEFDKLISLSTECNLKMLDLYVYLGAHNKFYSCLDYIENGFIELIENACPSDYI